MAPTKHKPEKTKSKLRQVDVLPSQRRPTAQAIRSIGATAFTCDRWRREFGGLKSDQLKRLKEPERENERLRKAIPDPTLEELILREAGSGSRRALAHAGLASALSWPGCTTRGG